MASRSARRSRKLPGNVGWKIFCAFVGHHPSPYKSKILFNSLCCADSRIDSASDAFNCQTAKCGGSTKRSCALCGQGHSWDWLQDGGPDRAEDWHPGGLVDSGLRRAISPWCATFRPSEPNFTRPRRSARKGPPHS
jgi:hypothetical protein